MPLDFEIKTEAYEGPLEVVLDLIEARKLLVNDLALADITDAFVEHVRAQEVFPVGETAEFIQIAATLILVKSKSLLPELTLTEEEEADVEDLKRRLEAYARVREAAAELGKIFGKTYLHPAGERAPEVVFAPSRDMTKESLAEALARLLAAREAVEALPEHKVKPMITIEEMMDKLAERVQSAMNLSFKEFARLSAADRAAQGSQQKIEVIVSFLALLELVKEGAVAAEQLDQHGDIHITHTAPASTPRYG